MTTTEKAVETIENAMLPAAVRAALVVALKKHPKTILTTVRINAGPHGIEVSANNLDCGFSAGLPTNEYGAAADIAIPRTAAELWAKQGAERIEVDSCAAAAGGVRSPVEDGRELPSVDRPSAPAASMAVPFLTLADIEKHIGAATDDESSRYALGGIYVESGAGCVRFVGTDGRRLHAYRFSRPSDGAFHHVVPACAFTGAVKAIGHTIDEKGAAKKRAAAALVVRIEVDDKGRGAFLWNVGNCSFIFSWRAIEGRFPRYRDIFPAWLDAQGPAGWFNAADMIGHAETCRKNVCTEQSKGIDIIGPVDGAGCKVAARSSERGEYDRPAVAYLPGGFRRKLDPAFFADAIRAAVQFSGGAETVDMFADSDKGAPVFIGNPAGIFAENAADPLSVASAFAAVIMPLAAD